MEVRVIMEALAASTTGVESSKEAQTYLDEAAKMIGFIPLLGTIAVNPQYEIPVRQAAVIMYKNLIWQGWKVEEEETSTDIVPVQDQDKHVIRSTILQSIIAAPTPIRTHFCTAIQTIVREDFPEKWPEFTNAMGNLLMSTDANEWVAALIVIHRFTKVYEYRRKQEKQPLYDFMKVILPLIYARFEVLVGTNTEESCSVEHMILKTFYTLTQFSMSRDIVSVEVFGKWLTLFIEILKRDLPPGVKELDIADQGEAYGWKCKKWAMKCIEKLFDRYGAKGQVEKNYEEYAAFYFEHFARPVTEVVLRILQDYTANAVVTERLAFFAMTHLAEAISIADIWKLVKVHFNDIVYHVVLPAMTPAEEDEEIWEMDELDFIRQRHDCFDELHSPSSAATTLLQAGLRRKDVLDSILPYFINHLSDANADPKVVAGCLHVVSQIISRLTQVRKYKRDVENLVAMHFTPRLTNPDRFIRKEAILKDALEGLLQRICDPNESIAVKVEAAIAINYVMDEQGEKAQKYIRPHVKVFLTEIFRLLTSTNLDDLTNIADTIIETFQDEVIPVAVEVASEIHALFRKYVKSAVFSEDADADDYDGEDKTITLMGLLGTLQTLLDLVDETPAISSKLEPVVFDIVGTIFESGATDFFEDAINLVESVIATHISDKAWEFYPLMRSHFDMTGTPGYPTLGEYIGCLHSYLVVDTDKFLSVPERALWLLEMCEGTLTNFEHDMSVHVNAAKLLEVFILQCRGRVDNYLPNILQVTMNRLNAGHFDKNVNNELVPQLLVVLIAAMHYNFEMFVHLLPNLKPFGMDTVQWLFAEIFANKDFVEGIHNRKMILYAICLMLRLPVEHQPPAIANNPKAVGEYCLELFQGIDRCVKALAARKEEDDDSDDSSDDDDDESMHPNRTLDELRDSDDDIDENTVEYLERLNEEARRAERETKAINGANGDDALSEMHSEDTDFDCFNEETDVESYVTPLDHEETGLNIYVEFKNSLEVLQANSPAEFTQLTSMEGENVEHLKKLFDYCVQQENLVHSRQVARAGGCTFDGSADVPSSFDFSHH
uniref:Importin N-terminal domain-containing protein n=1 Tax=Panagrellus redivivus TaxID=6233 RepID=A0A7E4UV58_PANRE